MKDGVFADFPDHAVYARESCSYLRSQGVEYTEFYRSFLLLIVNG